MIADPVRFALIGCGRISDKHLRGLVDTGGAATLAGVCDPVRERARAAGEAHDAPWFESVEALLAGCDAEVAIVGSPSGMHAEHVEAAAAAGLHVVCEKPLAVRLEDADRMIAACAAAGRRLWVSKQLRLTPRLSTLARVAREGAFGRIYLAEVNVFWTRPQSYYDEAPWRGTRQYDGGALMNQASHHLDLLPWIVGDVQSVQGATATLARDIECEDTGAAVLRFAGGGIGTVAVTMLTYPKNLETSLTILGERGTVKIGGPALDQLLTWQVEGDVPAPDARAPGPTGHGALFAEVAAILRGGPDTGLLCDGHGARRTLELILAIYRSADLGVRVDLPLSVEP